METLLNEFGHKFSHNVSVFMKFFGYADYIVNYNIVKFQILNFIIY